MDRSTPVLGESSRQIFYDCERLKKMSGFERVIKSLSRVLSWVAVPSLLVMMLITVANIIARPVGRPFSALLK